MRAIQAGAAVTFLLAGCVTLSPGPAPGSVISATTGCPLVDELMLSTHRQLIYGGRAGETIRMTYRERQGEHGLSQELQYDLASSRRIAFQAWRLEILEADNEHVTARVLPAVWPAGQGPATEVAAPQEAGPWRGR
jgi:hypothetical protein